MLQHVLFAVLSLGGQPGDLAEPFRIDSKSGPIDVSYGHSMPLMADWNGDGLKDLIVGQYSGGRLRIYTNAGTEAEPRFGTFEWFKTEAGRASVPIS